MGKCCLLVGAGAEIDQHLPSGAEYLSATYFSRKQELYSALKEFYNANNLLRGRIPGYRAESLFSAQTAIFRSLIESIWEIDSDTVAGWMRGKTRDIPEKIDDFQNEHYKVLFELMFGDDSEGSYYRKEIIEAIENLDSSFYGTVESLYSALISPSKHPVKFWKLLNYYWGAFFSILEPIVTSDAAKQMMSVKRDYRTVLDNLTLVIQTIWSDSFVDKAIKPTAYQSRMGGRFDYVLTTNYTPYSRVFLKNRKSAKSDLCYLAGSLVEFESAKTLEHVNCESKSILSMMCPFPYLMTRSPVKPIIDASQLRTYARAIQALDASDTLVVLGYSFCDDDAHIAAIVRDYIVRNGKRMFYLGYDDKTIAQHKVIVYRALRIEGDRESQNRIDFLSVHDAASPSVGEVLERIAS